MPIERSMVTVLVAAGWRSCKLIFSLDVELFPVHWTLKLKVSLKTLYEIT